MFDASQVEEVYAELRKIAAIHLGRSVKSPSLQATQLVHEAWMRLGDREWRSKTYFLALASRTMRMLLVDSIRARLAQKRPSSHERLELTPDVEFGAHNWNMPVEQIIDLDRALEELAILNERKAQVVEMRFFGGLDFSEISEALDASVATVKRDWDFSRAWLYNKLSPQVSRSNAD